MSEFDSSEIPYELIYRQKVDRGMHITFSHLPENLPIEIDLKVQHIEGITVEPDQQIFGQLIDNGKAIIEVQFATEHDELQGRSIGLAVLSNLWTPVGVVEKTLKCCVVKNRDMAYYFPEDVPADSRFGTPSEYHYLAATYAKVKVGEKVLFGPTGIT
jgi:hypothetical protein